MVDEASRLKQQSLQFGLDFDAQAPNVQRAQQFQGFEQQAQPLLQQAEAGADVRAENTFNQLKQAGLAGLANQFRRSQKNIAFETARRGTIGGSRSIERGQQAQAQAESGIGGVLNQARSSAEAQRQQELAPVFGFEQQLAQGDPFEQLSLQNQLQGIQQQGQAATGQFDLSNQLENIRRGSAINRAGFIQGAIGGIGKGIAGGIDRASQNRQTTDTSIAQLFQDPFGSVNPSSPNFVGPPRG